VKILVTGSNGRVGRYVVPELRQSRGRLWLPAPLYLDRVPATLGDKFLKCPL